MTPELVRVNRHEGMQESGAVVQRGCAASPEGDRVEPVVEAEHAVPRGSIRVVLRPSKLFEAERQS